MGLLSGLCLPRLSRPTSQHQLLENLIDILYPAHFVHLNIRLRYFQAPQAVVCNALVMLLLALIYISFVSWRPQGLFHARQPYVLLNCHCVATPRVVATSLRCSLCCCRYCTLFNCKGVCVFVFCVQFLVFWLSLLFVQHSRSSFKRVRVCVCDVTDCCSPSGDRKDAKKY